MNVCGFCGRDSFSVTLKKTSKKGGQEFFGINKCDCSNFYQYSRSKKFNKKTNPCTNRIERCSINDCLSNVWLYNFEHHFEEKHQNKEYATNMVVDGAERRNLLCSYLQISLSYYRQYRPSSPPETEFYLHLNLWPFYFYPHPSLQILHPFAV